MAKYYFKTSGSYPDINCTERCMVKNDGTMIGSANCLDCPYNISNNFDEHGQEWDWLICDKIKEATEVKS